MAKVAADTGSGPTPCADLVGRGLVGLAALMTIGAFANGVVVIGDAPADRVWVEVWRTTAFLVFAGLFALAAAAPRAHPGVWELALGQKVVVTVVAPFLGDAFEVRSNGLVDLVLVLVVGAGYVLCRGWTAWRGGLVTPPGAPAPVRGTVA